MFSKKCSVVVIILLCLCFSCTAVADTWICPECGSTNEGNFCPHDAHARPVSNEDTWTCPNCGYTGLTGNFCSHCATPRPVSSADQSGVHTIQVSSASRSQVDTYTFVALRDGYCVAEVIDIYGDYAVEVSITSSQGRDMMYAKSLGYQDVGKSQKKLAAGDTYTVTMRYWGKEVSDYTVVLYETRPVVEMTGEISDSFAYVCQTNYYAYTAPVNGTYAINLKDYTDDFYAMMTITDTKGHEIISRQIGAGFGRDDSYETQLTAGTVYSISMDYQGHTGSYTLCLSPKSESETSQVQQTETASVQTGSQIVTGTSSSKLYMLLDSIGRTSDADKFCSQFNGITVRENKVDYSSFLRTSFVSFQYQGYSFTEMKVDFSKTDHSLLSVVLMTDENNIKTDVEKMVADGALVKKANGSYVCAPGDGAYKITMKLNASASMLSSNKYYEITITR